MKKLLLLVASAGLAAGASAQMYEGPTVPAAGPVIPMNTFALPLGSPIYGGTYIQPAAAPLSISFDLGRLPEVSLQPQVAQLSFPLAVSVPADLRAPDINDVLPPSGGNSEHIMRTAPTEIKGIIEKLRDQQILTAEERKILEVSLKGASEIALDSKIQKAAWIRYQDADRENKDAMNAVMSGKGNAEDLRAAQSKKDGALKTFHYLAGRREAGVAYVTTIGILALHDLETRRLVDVELDRMRYSLSDIAVSARAAYGTFETQRASFRPVSDRPALARQAIATYLNLYL